MENQFLRSIGCGGRPKSWHATLRNQHAPPMRRRAVQTGASSGASQVVDGDQFSLREPRSPRPCSGLSTRCCVPYRHIDRSGSFVCVSLGIARAPDCQTSRSVTSTRCLIDAESSHAPWPPPCSAPPRSGLRPFRPAAPPRSAPAATPPFAPSATARFRAAVLRPRPFRHYPLRPPPPVSWARVPTVPWTLRRHR